VKVQVSSLVFGVSIFGFRVPGFGFRDSGLRFWVSGFGITRLGCENVRGEASDVRSIVRHLAQGASFRLQSLPPTVDRTWHM
jgi:hypothetical protein